ncbi:MAG: hypothetical protein U1E53_24555 [Dongiaceae bacterium]
MSATTPLAHLALLLLALPLQAGLVLINARRDWFTPGELRFWGVAVFVMLELAYLATL